MAKYDALRRHLEATSDARVLMTFAEVERIVGRPLPKSHAERSWWSNNPRNSGLTRQWLEAGFTAEAVDMPRKRLTFLRRTSDEQAGGARPKHPAFGALAGMFTIAPGVDLTAPLWLEEMADD
jgi:hypothetical protein